MNEAGRHETICDANGVPFQPIHAQLGAVELMIPPATIARALAAAQMSAQAPAAGQMNAAETLMRRLGPLAKGVAGVATGAILGLVYSMYGRWAPAISPPQLPAGADPTSYALAYLASLGMHALSARAWRLDYDETEEGSIVITRMAPADAAPDHGAPPRLGSPAHDAQPADDAEQAIGSD